MDSFRNFLAPVLQEKQQCEMAKRGLAKRHVHIIELCNMPIFELVSNRRLCFDTIKNKLVDSSYLQ